MGHGERLHALLSASGAHRWINCTPSARLEESVGRKETSVYAEEGTLAHEIAEVLIRRDVLKNLDEASAYVKLEALRKNKLYNTEMEEILPAYVEFCQNKTRECGKQTLPQAERRLVMSRWVRDSFGTADFCCCDPYTGKAAIVDLKWGKGVRVDAEDNPQLKMYALGVLELYKLYDVEEVSVAIVQPRLDHISEWSITTKDLLDWAEKVLVPAAEKAERGDGDLKEGDWCKFCAVLARCPRHHEIAMAVFEDSCGTPALMGDDEIAAVLSSADTIRAYLDAVSSYALERAYNDGVRYDGFKVVRSVTQRRWKDEKEAIERLKSEGYKESDLVKVSLRGIGEVERMLGKSGAGIIGELTVKPEGAPKLVPISDKRPEISASSEVDKAFKDDILN